jgi:small-conductance mechanosensitive channel
MSTLNRIGGRSISRARILIVLATAILAVFIVRRMKRLLSGRIGTQPAGLFEFIMIVLLVTISVFSLLHVFNIDTNTLLLSGGIISLTVGLVVSTFVGDTLAGMLVLLLCARACACQPLGAQRS